MLQSPDVLVAICNDWWIAGTNVLAIQSASTEAWPLRDAGRALVQHVKGNHHDRCRHHSSMRRSGSEARDRREIHPRGRVARSARRHRPGCKPRHPGDIAQDAG
ncbi:hypothetical protein [Bradyrhizobium sp. USDA 10063]